MRFLKELVCLICALMVTVESAGVGRYHLQPIEASKNEKHSPIDEGKHYGNMLMGANANKDMDMGLLQPLMQARYKRRVSEYAVRNKMSLPDEGFYSPYAQSRNYDNNNLIDGIYDGLKNQDDGGLWNTMDDDNKSDEGFWYNTATKPRYELKRQRAFDNIFNVKRFNRRPSADNYFY